MSERGESPGHGQNGNTIRNTACEPPTYYNHQHEMTSKKTVWHLGRNGTLQSAYSYL